MSKIRNFLKSSAFSNWRLSATVLTSICFAVLFLADCVNGYVCQTALPDNIFTHFDYREVGSEKHVSYQGYLFLMTIQLLKFWIDRRQIYLAVITALCIVATKTSLGNNLSANRTFAGRNFFWISAGILTSCAALAIALSALEVLSDTSGTVYFWTTLVQPLVPNTISFMLAGIIIQNKLLSFLNKEKAK